MDVAFLFLFFISIIALAVGLISPGAVIIWGDPERRTRMAACGFFGQAAILFITLYGIVVSAPYINFNLNNTTAASVSVLSVIPAGQGTDERNIILLAPQPDYSVPQLDGYAQYNWSNHDFGVINDSAKNCDGMVYIQGRIMAFNRDYTYVRITYCISSSDGSIIGYAAANTTNLRKGTLWHFGAQGPNVGGDFTYKVESVSAW